MRLNLVETRVSRGISPAVFAQGQFALSFMYQVVKLWTFYAPKEVYYLSEYKINGYLVLVV